MATVEYHSHGLSKSLYITLCHDIIVATMGAAHRVLFKEEKNNDPDMDIVREMRKIARECSEMMQGSANFEDIEEMGRIIGTMTETYHDIVRFEINNY